MASCGYFFASLRQRSCSSQCRYRSVNAVTKMHCCSERKTAFVQPFCSARCSANKSLKQRCFNVFCIVRELIRERVRKYKQRQKEKGAKNSSQDQDVSQAYQTPQALGKALGKVSSRVLPQSPRKRKAVVFKLAHASGFLRKKKCTRGNRGLPKETVNLVKVFFQLDSISRQAPGRKDFVTVRENNTKHHIQKRHLLWSLREYCSIFMKEIPTIEICLISFAP